MANLHPRLRLDRRAVARVITTLDAHSSDFRHGCPAGELSLVFMTDPALAQLHAEFLDDPSITDVITFEGNAIAGIAGEICVSADAAARQMERGESTRSKLTLKPAASGQVARGKLRAGPSRLQSSVRQREFSDELTLYLVHGWLHLAGFDDLVPAKKRVMRRAEARAMQILRANLDALPLFTLR